MMAVAADTARSAIWLVSTDDIAGEVKTARNVSQFRFPAGGQRCSWRPVPS
jgi:hypothetical protein